MEDFNKLIGIAKSTGIMLTIRYVVERDTWALLFHIDKDTFLGAEGNTLEAVCKEVLEKCNKGN